MRINSKFHLKALVSVMSMLTATAQAQTPAGKWNCQDSAPAAMRVAYGDRDGHDLFISDYACTIDGGPMAGAMVTGRNIMDFSAGVLNLVSGNGVIRNGAGAFYVFQNFELKLPFTMKDGKPTGQWTGGGKYKIVAASAAWSAYVGKSVSFTAATVAPSRFVVENTLD